MLLKGLELTSTLRITQATNAFDVKFKLDTTSSANIDSNFYGLLFFDLLTGTLTGKDGGTATTGFKFRISRTDNTVFCTSVTAGKLDWYETESNFIAEASSTIAAQAVGVDTWIKEVEIIYVSNNADVPKEIVVMSSTALANVSLATNDGQGTPVKGLKLATAGGAAAITANVQFVITK